MVRHRLTVPLLLILLVSSATAQFRTGNLKVRVTFADGRRYNLPVRVQLMSSGSTSPLAEAYTSDAGMTGFNNVEIGNYYLIVSGQGIEETDSGAFEVDNRRTSQFQYVTVKRIRDGNEAAGNASGPSTVAAADMNIPANAAKEFDKATDLIARQEWKKAMERLNKALAIYPQYAAAYKTWALSMAAWATGLASAKHCRKPSA
jgi:tetratricopeptide (TPR) repeat protein